ncbi:MAG: hypothetical protein ACI32N_00820 [Bulleidia sp.]
MGISFFVPFITEIVPFNTVGLISVLNPQTMESQRLRRMIVNALAVTGLLSSLKITDEKEEKTEEWEEFLPENVKAKRVKTTEKPMKKE